MEGLKDSYSYEAVEKVLKVAETLKGEKERLEKKVGDMESDMEKLKRQHSSEKQELRSQISSMNSTIAQLGQTLQGKDEEIVSLNEHIGRLSESDKILVENNKLKSRIKEAEESADKKLKYAKEQMLKAEAMRGDADVKLRNFDRCLKEKTARIKADASKEYMKKLDRMAARMKMVVITMTCVLFSQTASLVAAFDFIASDITGCFLWVGGAIKQIAIDLCGVSGIVLNQLERMTGNTAIAKLIAVFLAVVLCVIALFVIIRLGSCIKKKCRERWAWYACCRIDGFCLAVTIGIIAASMPVALLLRSLLPPPYNFNFIFWWLALVVGLNVIFHYTLGKD